jgi:hypothetical protein
MRMRQAWRARFSFDGTRGLRRNNNERVLTVGMGLWYNFPRIGKNEILPMGGKW